MTADTLWPLQTGLYAHLRGNAPLTALLAAGADGIHDHVPMGSSFPYIVIGELSARASDTQRHTACDAQITLHSFSRQAGMRELRDVMAAITASLHNAAPAISGHHIALCQEILTDVRTDLDGETRHGRQQFRIIIERT